MTGTPNNTGIQMLQGNYRFLMLGKYLEFIIQNKDFSKEVLDIAIVTGNRSHFGIKSSLIKTLLKQIHEHAEQKNIFGHLIEISSFRGVFGIMRELLENNEDFKKFSMTKLGDQYFSFEQIIRLLRNILSHATTPNIRIKIEDFVKQRDYLIHEKDPLVSFNFLYSTHRTEWKGNKNYGIQIAISFTELKDGDLLFDLVPLHQFYLLAELCNNLCELFRVQTAPKKPTKTIGKNKSKS